MSTCNQELARLAEIDKELADYARRWSWFWPLPGAGMTPGFRRLQHQEQRLQRQQDTLEMAVSRDDAEAPNRTDPALPERQESRCRQIAELQQQLSTVAAEEGGQTAANDQAYQRLAG